MGRYVRREEVVYAIQALRERGDLDLHAIYLDKIPILSKRQYITPKTAGQKAYVDAIRKYDIVFAIGPAGTGKSYLAVAMAVAALKDQEVSRLILTRPAVEAGESLGYLPGDLSAKVNPYLRPLYDALYDMMDVDRIQRYLERGIIEVAPLAYMRGRAQPHFSSVLTPRGYVSIGSLRAGDTVVGSDGAPTRVVGVYPQGRKEIFRIATQDGASALCCAEHLWAVYTRGDRRRNKSFRVLETRELVGRLRCAHYHRFELPLLSAPAQFPSRPVPLDPYALGLLLGDGCITGATTPSFSTGDAELACALEETLEGIEVTWKSGVDYVLRNVHGGRGGVIVANPVTTVLRNLDLCGTRSSTKFVPEIYLYNSADVRLAVLQGLLDTDGGPVVQDDRTCRIQYSTASMRLRDAVIFLVRSLGGIVYSRCRPALGRPPGRANGRDVRHVSDAHILDIRLPESIQPFRLSRKLERYRRSGGGHPARYLECIERVGEYEAVCIRVDAPDSLYVTDDFIVTHNTLNDSFVILDEAQNSTPEQMKMFLTRLGFDSKCVITGDVTQSDLPQGRTSGLAQAQEVLQGIEGISFVQFSGSDVVRHELVQEIIKAYHVHDTGARAKPGGATR
ncbi:MAG: PhoH family protein [Candidatus Omnitrophica bacterium]|nr:PhoH family protein [Candidatus Omnitrophota bacterium]